MGTASRKARADMAATAMALADLGDGADPKKLAAAARAHENGLKARQRAHERFAEAIATQRTARSELQGAGRAPAGG